MKEKKIISIKVDEILDSPWQGRQVSVNSEEKDAEIASMVESVSEYGMLQPVSVRKVDNKYELLDGHRRVLSAKIAGLDEIQAIIVELDDKKAQIITIISNLERKDLHPIEKAIAYRKILDDGLFPSNVALAEAIGKTTAYVGEILNNLKLDDRIIEDLVKNKTIADNRMLRAIRKFNPVDSNGKSDLQWELYNRAAKYNLSRDELIKEVKSVQIENEKEALEVIKNENRKNISFIIPKEMLSKSSVSQLHAMILNFVKRYRVGQDQ